jgi:hypothetical protein
MFPILLHSFQYMAKVEGNDKKMLRLTQFGEATPEQGNTWQKRKSVTDEEMNCVTDGEMNCVNITLFDVLLRYRLFSRSGHD